LAWCYAEQAAFSRTWDAGPVCLPRWHWAPSKTSAAGLFARGLRCTSRPALQARPESQKASVDQFQQRSDAGQPTHATQPAPAWHGQPQRDKGSSATEYLAVLQANVKAGHVAGLVSRTQARVVATDIQPCHRLQWRKRLVQADFPLAQRAGTVKHHGQCAAVRVRCVVKVGAILWSGGHRQKLQVCQNMLDACCNATANAPLASGYQDTTP
jgi:hypothetical protein